MKVQVGNTVQFKGQGIYEVVEQTENSRTKFTIKDIDKGAGYCHDTRKYVGVNVPNGWYLGKNFDYGVVIEDVHVKFLTPYVEPTKNVA